MQELCRKKGVNERKKLISVGHLNKMYCPCRVNQVPDTIYRISCKAVFPVFLFVFYLNGVTFRTRKMHLLYSESKDCSFKKLAILHFSGLFESVPAKMQV